MTFARISHRVISAHRHRHCVVCRTRVDTSALLGAGQYVDVAACAEHTQVMNARHCNQHDTLPTRCTHRRHTSTPLLPPSSELDQTTLSDARLMLPSGELDETYGSSLILAFSLLSCETLLTQTPEVHNVRYCRQRRTEP